MKAKLLPSVPAVLTLVAFAISNIHSMPLSVPSERVAAPPVTISLGTTQIDAVLPPLGSTRHTIDAEETQDLKKRTILPRLPGQRDTGVSNFVRKALGSTSAANGATPSSDTSLIRANEQSDDRIKATGSEQANSIGGAFHKSLKVLTNEQMKAYNRRRNLAAKANKTLLSELEVAELGELEKTVSEFLSHSKHRRVKEMNRLLDRPEANIRPGGSQAALRPKGLSSEPSGLVVTLGSGSTDTTRLRKKAKTVNNDSLSLRLGQTEHSIQEALQQSLTHSKSLPGPSTSLTLGPGTSTSAAKQKLKAFGVDPLNLKLGLDQHEHDPTLDLALKLSGPHH